MHDCYVLKHTLAIFMLDKNKNVDTINNIIEKNKSGIFKKQGINNTTLEEEMHDFLINFDKKKRDLMNNDASLNYVDKLKFEFNELLSLKDKFLYNVNHHYYEKFFGQTNEIILKQYKKSKYFTIYEDFYKYF